MRWPAYGVTFSRSNPRITLDNPPACSTFEGISRPQTLARVTNDPTPARLGAAATENAFLRESRTLSGARELDTHQKAREIPDLPASNGQRHWRIGARFGPVASDDREQDARPPPASHWVGVGEVSCVLSAPGRAGCPTSVKTDGYLGDSFMGYQSSELAFTSRDAGRGVLARSVGQASKGHSATKREMALRAKVGYCRALHHRDPCRVAALLCRGLPSCSQGSGDAPMEGIRPVGRTQFSGAPLQYVEPLSSQLLGLARCAPGHGCPVTSPNGPFTLSQSEYELTNNRPQTPSPFFLISPLVLFHIVTTPRPLLTWEIRPPCPILGRSLFRQWIILLDMANLAMQRRRPPPA